MPFLAQYTIRSKQAYIFRTNRMVEIVGASLIIRDTFLDLFRCAEAAGLRCEQDDGSSFSMAETLRCFQDGALDAVELFRGGGNDTVLFRDVETFKRANEAYTRFVLERYPGLLPFCVGSVAECVDYRADYSALMTKVHHCKSAMQNGRVENAQPFARLNQTTLQAVCVENRRGQRVEYRTAESDAKYRKGLQSAMTDEATRFLDSIARDERQSLLAVVHADGNSMGVKLQNMLGNETDYDFCVNHMRTFTREVHRLFASGGKAAVERCRLGLAEKYPAEPKNNQLVRWIVADGDDATFICNAKFALELTQAYLEGVETAGRELGKSYSACAGICVFHSHYPFSRAYELAEQACSNAKKPVHENRKEQAWVDFHYLRSGVNGELEDIRELHQTQRCIARPWFVCGEQPPADRQLETLKQLDGLLKDAKVARTQIKNLGAAFEASPEDGELSWRRICYNAGHNNLRRKSEELFNGDPAMLYRALYDMSDFYDVWFQKRGEKYGTAQDPIA